MPIHDVFQYTTVYETLLRPEVRSPWLPSADPESFWQLAGPPLHSRRSQFDAVSCNSQFERLGPVNIVADKVLKFEQHLADQRLHTFCLQLLDYPVPWQAPGPLKFAFPL